MSSLGAEPDKKIEAVILAAGRGTRMASKLPKVLHHLAGQELLRHVLTTVAHLEPESTHVVVGFEAAQVREALDDMNGQITWVTQEQQLGTAHAVQQATQGIGKGATVLVLLGDVPLITEETLSTCVEQAADNSICVVTAEVANPDGLGRIIRNAEGAIEKIVEQQDATDDERRITEINSGIMAIPSEILVDLLSQVSSDNAKKEYYLTDIVGIAKASGIEVTGMKAADADEVSGINTRQQLSALERSHQRKLARKLMAGGTAIADPERLDIRGEVTAGVDCFIDVNVIFEGEVVLGDGVSIASGCVISNSRLGNGVRVEPHTVVDGASVAKGCTLGPFARIRPGTVLDENVKIGNFVETKKATLGRGTKANHLAYLGDANLGEDCNVGAGTVTCNYDGAEKHTTKIGNEVFVGTNATLVAPLDIEDNAFVAAGSTITKTVEAGDLGVGRGRQKNIKGWRPPSARGTDKG